MSKYVEYIKVGSGEEWPVRDVEAHEALANKAPAGYGLGESFSFQKSWSEVDSIKTIGWYRFSSGVTVLGAAYGAAFMRVECWDSNLVVQTLYPNATSTRTFIRKCCGGIWYAWENEALRPYPVGAIYMSLDSTSPAILFGGTWERILGRFLLAAYDGAGYYGGNTGGEATHKLTVDEMPSHSHTPKGWAYQVKVDGSSSIVALTSDYTTVDNWSPPTNAVGGGQAHNNMPPYLAVYMWKRTA